MRAYTVRHDTAKFIDGYDLRDGSELIGGTVLGTGRHDLRQRFERISAGAGYLHITLSLPEGVQASRTQWHMIATFQLQLMGIDPLRTAWIAVRHRDGNCDHIHIAVSRRSFSGGMLTPHLSSGRTERNHIAMAARLGLPQPDYFNPAIPTLSPPVPMRRLRDPRAAKLAADLARAIRQDWPRDVDEFDAALARADPPIKRHVSLNRHGCASWILEQEGSSHRGGALGPAYEPRHIKARLALCAALDRTRLALELMRCLAALTPYHATMKGLLDAHQSRHADLAQRGRNSTRSTQHDRQQGEPTPAAPGPSADRNRRPLGIGRSTPECAAPDPERAPRVPDPSSGPRGADRHPDRRDEGPSKRDPRQRIDDPRDARRPDGAAGGLTWGRWLGNLLRLLRRHLRDWNWTRMPGHAIQVRFADQSEVLCAPREFTESVPGSEADRFLSLASSHSQEATAVPEYPAPEI